MLAQVHSIIQAAELLVGTVGSPQERLAKGLKAFWRATIFGNDWPVELWKRCNCICDSVSACGTWTMDRMDLKTARECATQLSKAMKDLAVAVERQKRRSDSASGNYSTVRFGPVGES
jgi:hypothetical protein